MQKVVYLGKIKWYTNLSHHTYVFNGECKRCHKKGMTFGYTNKQKLLDLFGNCLECIVYLSNDYYSKTIVEAVKKKIEELNPLELLELE